MDPTNSSDLIEVASSVVNLATANHKVLEGMMRASLVLDGYKADRIGTAYSYLDIALQR